MIIVFFLSQFYQIYLYFFVLCLNYYVSNSLDRYVYFIMK